MKSVVPKVKIYNYGQIPELKRKCSPVTFIVMVVYKKGNQT